MKAMLSQPGAGKTEDEIAAAREQRIRELEALVKSNQEWLESQMPKFDSEEKALAYAARLMAMKPGDRARTPDAVKRRLENAVYIGTDNRCDPLFFTYDEGLQRLSIVNVIWPQVILD